MKETYIINMKLPSLNEYVNICRTNRYAAAQYKRNLETEIYYFIAKMPRYEKPIKIRFHWIEGTKKRDLDNICFAKKFILDAMVKAGKLKDDNRKHVTAFTDEFSYGKETKVIIEIEEVGNGLL
jgi:Holliday junction resolvase RusA-like endonuclease